MSRYAKCPGLECQAKVKIIDLVPEPEVNFCCIPCWEFTWSSAYSEDDSVGPVRGHSSGCWDRQAARVDEPVVEGEFKVHTPSMKNMPPSRLGGPGAGAV